MSFGRPEGTATSAGSRCLETRERTRHNKWPGSAGTLPARHQGTAGQLDPYPHFSFLDHGPLSPVAGHRRYRP